MQSPISEARHTFLNAPLGPRCVIVANGEKVDIPTIATLFDLNSWAVTWLDTSGVIDANQLVLLPTIFDLMDLVYIVVTDESLVNIDTGYYIGVAKFMHKPVFVEFRCDINKYDYPAVFKIVDGLGLGVDDLTLFIDTFETYGGLSDFATRARAVANKIKSRRFIL